MSRVIDLGILVQEPLIFKAKNGEVYTIPGEISTKFVIKLSKFQEELTKINTDEESVDILQQMVCEILSLDKTKEIDLDYIKENFDDIRIHKIIVEAMMQHIQEIAQDPNSNSLESAPTIRGKATTKTTAKSK